MEFNEARLPRLLNQTFIVRSIDIFQSESRDSQRYERWYEQDSLEYHWRMPSGWPKINHAVDHEATKTRTKLSYSLFVFPFNAANEREEHETRDNTRMEQLSDPYFWLKLR